jgi:putative tryptophan/tyrosine transport system substrate-binding protein
VKRREFIAGLGAAATPMIWPRAVSSQQTSIPVVGYLIATSLDGHRRAIDHFQQALAASGYVEGRNVTLEYRAADDQYDRLPRLAADLVSRKVDVIVAAGGSPALLAAKSATTTIPIVFVFGGDPVARGIVASLSRPGGNLTGITALVDELGPKRLQLLREVVPTTRDFGFLINPTNQNAEVLSRDMEAAAHALGLQVRILGARTDRDLDAAFAAVARLRAGGLVIGGDVFFNGHIDELGALTIRYAVPAIYQYRSFVAAGGLVSYGTDDAEWARLLGIYASRILKGEKPSDLPVQQSTKLDLAINLKTAKALGLTIPPNLLAIADEVIE